MRFHRIGKLRDMHSFWRDWELLFSQIEESHTSLPVLVFMRSPKSKHSWVTAAGNVLDAASFFRSTVDVPRDPRPTFVFARATWLWERLPNSSVYDSLQP